LSSAWAPADQANPNIAAVPVIHADLPMIELPVWMNTLTTSSRLEPN
jgi:hypothetical protein